MMYVFLGAAFLWVVPGRLSNLTGIEWLGGLDDTAIAISAGLVMFLLPGRGRTQMFLEWKDAENGLPWGVLLLYGGGLSLASAVAASGLDGWFGQQVTGLGTLRNIALVAAVVTIILFLIEITSNTATAATVIPMLGGVALGIGAEAMNLFIPAAFAATCAFMLPVGTPPERDLLRHGRSDHYADGARRSGAEPDRHPADHACLLLAWQIRDGPDLLRLAIVGAAGLCRAHVDRRRTLSLYPFR